MAGCCYSWAVRRIGGAGGACWAVEWADFAVVMAGWAVGWACWAVGRVGWSVGSPCRSVGRAGWVVGMVCWTVDRDWRVCWDGCDVDWTCWAGGWIAVVVVGWTCANRTKGRAGWNVGRAG